MKIAALAFGAMAAMTTAADAALQFTVNRQSDSTISLSGSGSVGGTDGSYVSLTFLGLAATNDASSAIETGTLVFGSKT